MENWTSRRTNEMEGVVDYEYTKVLKWLNIGNRAPFHGHNDIFHEDVLESR